MTVKVIAIEADGKVGHGRRYDGGHGNEQSIQSGRIQMVIPIVDIVDAKMKLSFHALT